MVKGTENGAVKGAIHKTVKRVENEAKKKKRRETDLLNNPYS